MDYLSYQNLLPQLLLLVIALSTVEGSPPCTVDTAIVAFREDTPQGTVILRIPYREGEVWQFEEGEPLGYLAMNSSSDSGDHLVTFRQSPDLEEINQKYSNKPVIESLKYTLNCSLDGMTHTYQQSVAIADVNEKQPYFTQGSYITDIDELTPPGTTVFTLQDKAVDDDITGTIALFRLHPYNDSQVDGRGQFDLSAGGQHIILTKPLDYDTMWLTGSTYYVLNISVQDNGYPRMRVAFTTLLVRVTDADDQGPAFVYRNCPKADNSCITPAYIAYVRNNTTGPLQVYPGSIRAEDRDIVKNNILYSIIEVLPQRYSKYFWINSRTGRISQLRNIPGIHNVSVAINAEEISPRRRSISCTLLVLVEQQQQQQEEEGGTFREIPSQIVIKKTAKISDSRSREAATDFSWTEGSVSIVIFFIVIGGLVVLLVAMTAAFLAAYTTRKPRRRIPNVSFDDCSSNSTSGTSLGSRDNVSGGCDMGSVRSSVNDDKAGDIRGNSCPGEGKDDLDTTIDIETFNMGLAPDDVSLGHSESHVGMTGTGNDLGGCSVTSVDPVSSLSREEDYFSSACVIPGLTELRPSRSHWDNADTCSKYNSKKKGKKSLRILDMFSSKNKNNKNNTATHSNNNKDRRFNFGLEQNWLDLPYNFE